MVERFGGGGRLVGVGQVLLISAVREHGGERARAFVEIEVGLAMATCGSWLKVFDDVRLSGVVRVQFEAGSGAVFVDTRSLMLRREPHAKLRAYSSLQCLSYSKAQHSTVDISQLCNKQT